MSEIKRGAVLLLQAGDPEITGPLKDGVLAGRAARLEAQRKQPAEVDWSKVARRVRVAVGNTKTAEDYMILRSAAEQEYRVRRRGGRLARLAEALLGAYALTVYRLHEYFNWEGSRWRGN